MHPVRRHRQRRRPAERRQASRHQPMMRAASARPPILQVVGTDDQHGCAANRETCGPSEPQVAQSGRGRVPGQRTIAASPISPRQAAATTITSVPAAAAADPGDAHCELVASCASIATPKAVNAAIAQPTAASPARAWSAGASWWLLRPAQVHRATSPLLITSALRRQLRGRSAISATSNSANSSPYRARQDAGYHRRSRCTRSAVMPDPSCGPAARARHRRPGAGHRDGRGAPAHPQLSAGTAAAGRRWLALRSGPDPPAG